MTFMTKLMIYPNLNLTILYKSQCEYIVDKKTKELISIPNIYNQNQKIKNQLQKIKDDRQYGIFREGS